MEHIRARVTITGRVQAVNFRASTREQARVHGVSGWVRNLDDGRVEAVFEGPKDAVKNVVSWCYSGPTHARVERVEVQWDKPTGNERGFQIVW
jgi:acylphosphatase